MGSAVLYFAVNPKRAILSDLNPELTTTFIAVRDHPRAVFNRLQKLRKGKQRYYELRALDPSSLDDIDRAVRFIFLNRFCFNGLYRTNNAGFFNVPYSPTGTGNLPSWEALRTASHLLACATIEQADFATVLNRHAKKGDFVYLDPPYATDNKRIFRQYGPAVFGLEDLKRLSALLRDLDKRGVHFVVSYGWCPEGREAFSHWDIEQVYTQRNIAGFYASRRKSAEMIVTNI